MEENLTWEERKKIIPLILKDLREQSGKSQKEIAAYLSLNYSTISHYESGKLVPPTEVIYRLAELYNVSTDYILTRSVSKFNYEKVIEEKLDKELLIGDAVEILLKASKQDKEHFSFILKLYKQRSSH